MLKKCMGTVSFYSKNILSAFIFLQGFSNAGVFSIHDFLIAVKRLWIFKHGSISITSLCRLLLRTSCSQARKVNICNAATPWKILIVHYNLFLVSVVKEWCISFVSSHCWQCWFSKWHMCKNSCSVSTQHLTHFGMIQDFSENCNPYLLLMLTCL